MNMIGNLLVLASAQLNKVDNAEIVTAIALLNNWTAAALEGNELECQSIVREAKLSDPVIAIADQLYNKCNAANTAP